ncbi:MAG: hypothetical protein D6741_19775 [Planctomycetota bacterium]|nr:MAG: hypothetical protein D6741_19775 [Planctomycetota bacterium]
MNFDDTAGELRLFVDGEEVAMTTTDQSIGNFDAPLQVGSPIGLYTPDGTFDNTRIWNVARTPVQIREGMSRQYDGDPSLVVDYRYDTTEAQTVLDHSGYHNDGIRSGTIWPVPVKGLAITNPAHFRFSVEDGRGGFDEQSFDVRFVPPLRGSISGTVFVDANADGTFQAGEQVLPDWLLYADTNGNAFPDPGEPQATTDASGQYTITGLLPDDYPLRVQPRAGFETPAIKTARVSANQETLADVAITELTLGQIRGQIQTAVNTAAAHQQVFADLDRDGTLDTGEPTAMTDALGDYAITGLSAGNYDIRLTPRAGWQVTDPVDGLRRVTLDQDGISTGNDFTLNPNTTTAESGLAFVTTPNLSGAGDTLEAGSVFRYQALAQNWSGSSINYDISLAPDGLSIDSQTGLVIWQPNLNQLGDHRIVLRARDGDDGVALQDFSLRVVAPDTPPAVTSTPPNNAHVGIPVVYQVDAQDAESSALTFSLTAGPATASIHADTGVLHWTPQSR